MPIYEPEDMELSWAAGFFDGEGTISQTTARATTKRYLIMRVAQCDRRPLDRFAKVAGLGNVNGPYQHKKGEGRWSDFYTWQAAGTRAEEVFARLTPHLSEPKREQYARVKELIS